MLEALPELITNSDDAYVRGHLPTPHRIFVKVNYQTRDVYVWDHALGMSQSDMLRKLRVVGEFTAETKEVRGSFSRGAKDISRLGTVYFTGLKDGKLTQCTISPQDEFRVTVPERRITSADRALYHIPKNGFHVRLHLLGATKLPLASQLENIAKYYSLRDIFSKPGKHVSCDIVNKDGSVFRRGLLRYVPLKTKTTALIDQKFRVPGWPGAEAHFRLYALRDKAPLVDYRPFREYGIVVDTQTTIHDNLLFNATVESHPMVRFLTGRLTCNHIDQLMHDFDAGVEDDRNTFPLVNHGRNGLDRDHPFFKDLSRVVVNEIQYVLNDMMKSQVGQDELSLDIGSVIQHLNVDDIKVWRELDAMSARHMKDQRQGLERILRRHADHIVTEQTSKYRFSNVDSIRKAEMGNLRPVVQRLKITISDQEDMVVPFETFILNRVLTVTVNSRDAVLRHCLTPQPDAKTSVFDITDVPRFVDRVSGFVARSLVKHTLQQRRAQQEDNVSEVAQEQQALELEYTIHPLVLQLLRNVEAFSSLVVNDTL